MLIQHTEHPARHGPVPAVGPQPATDDRRGRDGVLVCERGVELVATQVVDASCVERDARRRRTTGNLLRQCKERAGRRVGEPEGAGAGKERHVWL